MNSTEFCGKAILVNGASRGLGLCIAEAFWSAGAHLFLVARHESALSAVCDRLMMRARKCQQIGFVAADLGSTGAADRILEAFRIFSPRLDVLVNNAALQGPIGPLECNDWAAWQNTIQVNLLAPVALCRGAIPTMEAAGGGSMINLSGGGATSPRPYFSAYATAKAGLVRFSETMAQELAGRRIRVNCIAPGAMNSEMTQAVLRAGAALAGEEEYRRATAQTERGDSDFKTPAQLAVYLASERSAAITGRLISAVWDPWTNLGQYADQLARSDIYTLRRITPEDRGARWTA